MLTFKNVFFFKFLNRMIDNRLILVDENDNQIGFGDKIETHVKGILHRAVSVFLFDLEGNWILQQRAFSKYHSAGLWSNTCCTHPYINEETKVAANRRLKEELGVDCELNFAFKFLYKANLNNGLIEHELDHVFIGFTNKIPIPNELEVYSWRKSTYLSIKKELNENPENYTEWFRLIFEKVNEWHKMNNN